MFSFQAIHNAWRRHHGRLRMSKSYYRVFFSSNSQHMSAALSAVSNVKELLSCFLFKQFTTLISPLSKAFPMSKSYYRVFFSSNSQPINTSSKNFKEKMLKRGIRNFVQYDVVIANNTYVLKCKAVRKKGIIWEYPYSLKKKNS